MTPSYVGGVTSILPEESVSKRFLNCDSDPTIFTRPWTMAFAIKRFEKGHEVLEEACYEGDRSVPNLMQTGFKPYIGLSRAR